MSKIEVDEITQQSGTTVTVGGGSGKTAVLDATTVTIGRCGGTVALASGASQTGFGRTGTVNWNTTIKTSDFTATSGSGFFVDTSSGAVTVTLPASPSAGDIVSIADYAGTSATNKISIARNGSNIEGTAVNSALSDNRAAVTLIFADSTQGWIPVNDNADSSLDPSFVAATGGTVTTVCTNFKVHTFTGPGTFCVSNAGNSIGSNTVSYVVVAGGGSGGGSEGGGGGGAGGYRESESPTCSYTQSPVAASGGLPVSVQGYPITVGGGGAIGSPANAKGVSGSNSIFSTITSTGGGGGGASCNPGTADKCGQTGGSGGGGGETRGAPDNQGSGGAGNTPSVSPPQGNNGGPGSPQSGNPAGAGGGGGIGAVGQTGPSSGGGCGGCGVASSITGSSVGRAGGGGGGVFGPAPKGSDQSGSGGAEGGRGSPQDNADSAAANKGGGGGGSGKSCVSGGAGGSGIVIIRYKFQ